MNVPKRIHRTGLARALSKLGFCSRAAAVKLVRQKRVRVNSRTVHDAETPVSLGTDKIFVDGQEVGTAEKTYLMMNKPRGLVTTANDEKGRNTVYDLLKGHDHWLAPVGRLDKASEGLLLFTNDSNWASQITAPETHLDKTYHVQIDSLPDQPLLDKLIAGIRAEDGEALKVKRASTIRQGEKNSWIEIVLDEGRNRHIRRLLSAFGFQVLRLVRIAIGPLQLGDLPKGSVRELKPQEKAFLDRALRLRGRS